MQRHRTKEISMEIEEFDFDAAMEEILESGDAEPVIADTTKNFTVAVDSTVYDVKFEYGTLVVYNGAAKLGDVTEIAGIWYTNTGAGYAEMIHAVAAIIFG
jgi:hypothetical protein